jgi:hypothetical protein
MAMIDLFISDLLEAGWTMTHRAGRQVAFLATRGKSGPETEVCETVSENPAMNGFSKSCHHGVLHIPG